MTFAELTFWSAVGIVGYAYLGYPATVWVLARFFPHPVRTHAITPTITILIAAHNEEGRIAAKIENCLALVYPPGRLDVIVVSDGSTDRTAAIVEEYASRFSDQVRVLTVPRRLGKANALNAAAALASAEILLLTDVRQRFESDVPHTLARNFADPQVGAVSGELLLTAENRIGLGEGLGLYWQYEKAIRYAESRLWSSIGYTGAISAVRRSLFSTLPPESLVDDLLMPLRIAGKGYRVIFEPAARAVDWMPHTPQREFARKVRTLAGVLQTTLEFRRFVGPVGLQILWQFASHKVSRLIAPYALVLGFIVNIFLDDPLYRVTLLGQVLAYGLGIAGLLSVGRSGWSQLLSLPATFLTLNAAAVVGSFYYLAGRRLELWDPTRLPHGLESSAPSHSE